MTHTADLISTYETLARAAWDRAHSSSRTSPYCSTSEQVAEQSAAFDAIYDRAESGDTLAARWIADVAR